MKNMKNKKINMKNIENETIYYLNATKKKKKKIH